MLQHSNPSTSAITVTLNSGENHADLTRPHGKRGFVASHPRLLIAIASVVVLFTTYVIHPTLSALCLLCLFFFAR